MAHIAIDARIINSSTGTYVERLLAYLQDIDQENIYSVLVPKKDKDFWKPRRANFTVRTIEYPNYSFAEQIGFKKYLDDLSPDLVHFCMPQQPVRYRGASVTTFHDLSLLRIYNSDKNWLVYHAKQLVGRYIFKRVARQTNHILTPTNYVKKDVSTTLSVPTDNITVTYEAADISVDTLEPYDHPFDSYLLYVGQQSDYKNIRRLGDAHQQLLENHPNLGLILVGRVNASAAKNKVYFEKNGYTNILFTDFLADPQRNWLYKNATAYVFPSLTEGFGLPGLEAMGYGAPVVSSDATCLPEVYGDAAHYFNPLNTDDITRAIREVIDDETRRAELVSAGYTQLKKYSWLRMVKQTKAVYDEVLKSTSQLGQ